MRNEINAINHSEAHLLHEAINYAKKYGRIDGDGCRNVRMTYVAFGRKFGHIDDLRGAIDRIEAAYDRIGFYLMPGYIVISHFNGR